MKTSAIVAIVMLALPATAGAAPIIPPIGAAGGSIVLDARDSWALASIRESNMNPPFEPAGGAVRTAAGTLQWGASGCRSINLPWGPTVPGACTVVQGMVATWYATRAHQYRQKGPWMTAVLTRFYAGSSNEVIFTEPKDQFVERPELNTPDCNPSGENRKWFLTPLVGGVNEISMLPNHNAPDDFVAGCGGKRQGEATTEGDDQKPASAAPAKVKSCAPIAHGKKRVAVTSLGMQCGPARNVLARYMRRGIEPRGWVCARLGVGKVRAASCGTPGRSAKRVVGRWLA